MPVSSSQIQIPRVSRFQFQSLEELQNYHALMAVVLGMNLNAIFRLQETWEVGIELIDDLLSVSQFQI